MFCYHCVRSWPLFSFMQWYFFNFVCIPCEFGLTFVCTFTVHSLWMWNFLGHPRKMVFKPDSIITTKIPKIWNWTVFPSKQNQKYKIDVKIAAIFLCGILCTDDQFHHFEMWPNSTKIEKSSKTDGERVRARDRGKTLERRLVFCYLALCGLDAHSIVMLRWEVNLFIGFVWVNPVEHSKSQLNADCMHCKRDTNTSITDFLCICEWDEEKRRKRLTCLL